MEGELPRCARPCRRKTAPRRGARPRFRDRGDLPVTVTGRSPRSRNEAGLTRGHGPSAHEPDMPADLGARGVCHALIGRGLRAAAGRAAPGTSRTCRAGERTWPARGGWRACWSAGRWPAASPPGRGQGRRALPWYAHVGAVLERPDNGAIVAGRVPRRPGPGQGAGRGPGPCPVALDGRFGGHHALTRRPRLEHIGHLEAAIAKLDAQTEVMTTAFPAQPELLTAVPGAGPPAAAAPIREPAAAREPFPGAAHLAPRTRAAPRQ